jgi:23S rRNA pseudouridine1911/1915/1917 synthase
VTQREEGQRLDLFLSAHLRELSRSLIQRYIEQGEDLVLVNSGKKKSHYIMKKGDTVEVQIPEPKLPSLLPMQLKLEVLHEDEDILVINKPPGIPTHPSYGHENDTIVNALLAYFGDSGILSTIGGERRPGIVHRLDKDTAGVLLVAKNDTAHTRISREFAQKGVEKVYEAIVKGVVIPKAGTIEYPIRRSERNRKKFRTGEDGKHAVTLYDVIESIHETTWVRFRPETGRTHQIRVHAASIGHPILGDPLYARRASPVKYMALFAKELEITHPTAGKRMRFTAPYPEHFIELGEILGYNITNSVDP